jgi:hypothetical protein
MLRKILTPGARKCDSSSHLLTQSFRTTMIDLFILSDRRGHGSRPASGAWSVRWKNDGRHSSGF